MERTSAIDNGSISILCPMAERIDDGRQKAMNLVPTFTKVVNSRISNYVKNCKCTPRCKEFYRVDGFDVYCKGGLRELVDNALTALTGRPFPIKKNSRSWSALQIETLIAWGQNSGIRYGDYQRMGELLGKSPKSISQMIYKLERQGRMKPEWRS